MKIKRISKILTFIVLVIALSVAGTNDVDATNKTKNYKFQKPAKNKIIMPKKSFKKPVKKSIKYKKKKCVKTPIDASALILLTGAGAAYIGIRRKQKK